jgi:hypothetical protein
VALALQPADSHSVERDPGLRSRFEEVEVKLPSLPYRACRTKRCLVTREARGFSRGRSKEAMMKGERRIDELCIPTFFVC